MEEECRGLEDTRVSFNKKNDDGKRENNCLVRKDERNELCLASRFQKSLQLFTLTLVFSGLTYPLPLRGYFVFSKDK
jgi:hypothetical protein